MGGGQPLSSDFRLLCATHRNLPELIAAGGFRSDFYYRINVFSVAVPPLRERREDIVPWPSTSLPCSPARPARSRPSWRTRPGGP